jgi:hypothetical protein
VVSVQVEYQALVLGKMEVLAAGPYILMLLQQQFLKLEAFPRKVRNLKV